LFDRRRVGVDEMIRGWIPLIERLSDSNPELRIMFTVSPIRHLRDGAHENQLSKSVLLLFVDELCRMYPDRCIYFPSYEIVMDELRDYRFYDAGMTHPNEQAIRYIWERFSEACFSEETQTLNREWERLEKALNHRPLTPDKDAFRDFTMQNLFKLKKIWEKYSYFDLSKEIDSLELFLKTL
jgi:GSCFA family protein